MAETTVTSPPSAVLRALGVTMGGAGCGPPGAQTEQCLGLMGALALGTDMGGRVKTGASCWLPRKGRLSTEDLC